MIGTTAVASPQGKPLTFSVRSGTNDAALAHGILGEDEYRLAQLPQLSGWALDIGAHIGIVTVALAVDHPNLRIVAVEAIPDNAELLRENVARNGVADRVIVESAAAAAPGETDVPITYGWTHDDAMPDDYLRDSRFIGGLIEPNATSVTEARPALSLGDLLEKHHIDRVTLCKIDCEGCEYAFLSDPAVSRIDRIIGEWHTGVRGTYAERTQIGRLRDILAATHLVRPYDDKALFEAVR